MDITNIGWIILLLTIYGFIKSEKILLYVTVFFSIFTAASIVNIEVTNTGILPFYLPATFWILKVTIRYIKTDTLKEKISEIRKNKLIKALLVLIAIVFISNIINVLIQKNIYYTNFIGETINVKFSFYNITQTIYFYFIIVFTIYLILEVKSKKEIKKVFAIFSVSCIFAILWGIIQFCMFYLNIEYPHYLFNNNISLGQLYNQMVYGVKRINSIALEPSTFALNLLAFISITFPFWIFKYKEIFQNVIKKYILQVIIIITLICAILTTSTTAYVGIIVLILFLTIYGVFFSIENGEVRKNIKRLFNIYIVLGTITLLIIILIPKIFKMDPQTIIDALKDVTINKFKLQSGNERKAAISQSLYILSQSPLFGAGWGSFRSLDLTTNLLANLGISGLLSYLYIIFTVIKKAISIRKSNEVIMVIILSTILVPTVALMISIPDINFLYYWIILGVSYNYCIED